MGKFVNKIADTVGFEIEIGAIQINSIVINKKGEKIKKNITNGEVLFSVEDGEGEFFRIETEGTKSCGSEVAYPEVISRPLSEEAEVKKFFIFASHFINLKIQVQGEKRIEKIGLRKSLEIAFEEAIKELKVQKSKYIIKFGENIDTYIFASTVSGTRKPTIHINLGINIEDVYRGIPKIKSKASEDKIFEIIGWEAGEYLRAAREYTDVICDKKYSDTIKAMFILMMYQLIVYIKNAVVDNYMKINVNCDADKRGSEYKAVKQQSDMPGSDDSNVKLKFKALFKVAQADIIRLVLNDNIKELEELTEGSMLRDKIKAIIASKIKYEGRDTVEKDKKRADGLVQYLIENIKAYNEKSDYYYYNEPRYSGLILPYADSTGNYHVVMELRSKSIPIISSLEGYFSNSAKGNELKIKEMLELICG